METILKQVGDLLLGAIPTVVLLLLLYGLYHLLVHKPLERILAERRARTVGAVEKARADIALAEARAAEYEQKLREARVSVFRAQESRRQQALEARQALVSQARKRAQELVAQAKAQLDQDVATARTGLRAESERLADQIIQSVLQPTGAGQAPALGGR